MFERERIIIGKSGENELFIEPKMANRHGLITGASGSGKTITLKVMAESFSSMGVPVFLADIKGDLAATCLPGQTNENIEGRLSKLGITNFEYKGFPTVFWDVFAKNGHPIRTTLQKIGPTILSRILGLSEAQEGVLAVIFRIAKENGYDLIDIKDLRLVLQYVAENSKEYTISYGNIATQSVGTIQRKLVALEEQGGNFFFGEPDIDINDFVKVNENGFGNINILHCVELFKEPNLYSCFMLWLLTTLNASFPEVGDMDKPKMIFFFDEAHLLFNNLPDYMLTQVVQIVKLIRSKGIGLYFISQSPNDIPSEILGQLGNKVQHTLRAYTPQEQKGIKAIASSFRTNPSFDTEESIMSLGTGEALISFLNDRGEPNIVEKATILPPQSQMGTLDDPMRLMIISRSALFGKYDTPIDRESAYEILSTEMTAKREEEERVKEEKEKQKALEQEQKAKEKAEREAERIRKAEERQKKELEKEAEKARKNSLSYKMEKEVKRTANVAKNTLTRKAVNQIIKNLFK